MPKSLYSIEINVTATAYIKANNRLDALATAKTLHGDCLDVADDSASEVAVSGLPFDDPALPDVSISPVMTIWNAVPSSLQIAADNANRAATTSVDQMSPEAAARRGLELLKQARDLFKHAGARQTLERVRLAITSGGGAVRHARGKASRGEHAEV